MPGVAARVRGVGAPPDGVSSQSVITTLLPKEHMVHIYMDALMPSLARTRFPCTHTFGAWKGVLFAPGQSCTR